MKNNYCLLLYIVLAIPLISCIVHADHNLHPTSGVETNEWDHVGMEFIFEDQTLSDAAIAIITNDYTSILDHLKPRGRRNVRPTTIELDSGTITRTSSFLYNTKYVYYPADTQNQIGVIVEDGDGVEHIFIPENLSDTYKAVIALNEAHADAFHLLPEFVALLNNLNNIEKGKLPALDQLIHFVGRGADEMTEGMQRAMEDPQLREQYTEQFIASYNMYRYEIGSILDRFIEDELLHVKLHTWQKETGKRDYEFYFYAVYDEDTWKLHIPLM